MVTQRIFWPCQQPTKSCPSIYQLQSNVPRYIVRRPSGRMDKKVCSITFTFTIGKLPALRRLCYMLKLRERLRLLTSEQRILKNPQQIPIEYQGKRSRYESSSRCRCPSTTAIAELLQTTILNIWLFLQSSSLRALSLPRFMILQSCGARQAPNRCVHRGLYSGLQVFTGDENMNFKTWAYDTS